MTNNNKPVSGMVAALMHAETFTRAQVVDLLARAFASEQPADLIWQAGYEAGWWARVAQENAAYPPEPMRLATTAAQDAVSVHRSRMRVDERYERPDDHMGGPVPAW